MSRNPESSGGWFKTIAIGSALGFLLYQNGMIDEELVEKAKEAVANVTEAAEEARQNAAVLNTQVGNANPSPDDPRLPGASKNSIILSEQFWSSAGVDVSDTTVRLVKPDEEGLKDGFSVVNGSMLIGDTAYIVEDEIRGSDIAATFITMHELNHAGIIDRLKQLGLSNRLIDTKEDELLADTLVGTTLAQTGHNSSVQSASEFIHRANGKRPDHGTSDERAAAVLRGAQPDFNLDATLRQLAAT